ncbi:unnamed protein product [Boreogadus saida]
MRSHLLCLAQKPAYARISRSPRLLCQQRKTLSRADEEHASDSRKNSEETKKRQTRRRQHHASLNLPSQHPTPIPNATHTRQQHNSHTFACFSLGWLQIEVVLLALLKSPQQDE